MRRIRTPLVHGSGPQALVRWLLLLCVVAGCIWAFSQRFEYKMAELVQRDAELRFRNITGEAAARLEELIGRYRKNLGISVRVELTAEDVLLPGLAGRDLFVGLSPERGQAIVVFPTLVRKALAENELSHIKSVISNCVHAGDVGGCLAQSLDTLYDQLDN